MSNALNSENAFGRFCLSTFVSVPMGLMLWGLVVMKYWLWFIAPVFSMEVLAYGQAVGLAAVVQLLRIKNAKGDDASYSAILDHMLWVIVAVPVMLGIGWVTHLLTNIHLSFG